MRLGNAKMSSINTAVAAGRVMHIQSFMCPHSCWSTVYPQQHMPWIYSSAVATCVHEPPRTSWCIYHMFEAWVTRLSWWLLKVVSCVQDVSCVAQILHQPRPQTCVCFLKILDSEKWWVVQSVKLLTSKLYTHVSPHDLKSRSLPPHLISCGAWLTCNPLVQVAEV